MIIDFSYFIFLIQESSFMKQKGNFGIFESLFLCDLPISVILIYSAAQL